MRYTLRVLLKSLAFALALLLSSVATPFHLSQAADSGASAGSMEKSFGGYASNVAIQKGIVSVNASGVTRGVVEKTDKLWKSNNIAANFVGQMQRGPCADQLKQWMTKHAYITGAFVIGELGEVACMVGQPNAYDFSSHPLVVKALGDGKQTVIVGDVRKSEVSNRDERDVLVPVRDPMGYAIGAIWFTVDTKKFSAAK